jgi:hypothetical protein
MRQIKCLLCLLLALCILLPGLPAARAEEPAETAEPEQTEDDERFADKTWDEVVEEFLQSWGVDPKYVAIGYYNTVTGEEHYLDPDTYRITASMYKVPLNMVFLDRLSKGEMDWDTNVSGYAYSVALEQTIVHSDNDIARNMIKWELGNGSWQAGRRVMAPYCGLDPENVDWKFQENNYSTARQMIYCLRLLYENPDRFPRLVETMQRAEPTEYFKRREQRFDIAHKYGFLQTEYHLYMNDCGICFTDDPILLVLFTDNVTKAYEVMTEFCTLMCDYTQYHTAIRLKQEAEEAERQRLEAERQAEEARQAALEAEQEAQRLAEEALEEAGQGGLSPLEPGESRQSKSQAGDSSPVLHLVRQAEQEGISRKGLMAAAAALLLTLTALIFLGALGRKYRVKVWWAVLLALLLCLALLGWIGWPALRQMQDDPISDPRDTVTAFLDALERQDYPAAYAMLDGVDSLGLEWEPEDETLRLILRSVRESFHGELLGECRVDDTRAWQQVECKYLDLSTLEARARSETLRFIAQYANSHTGSELFEGDSYRPDLMCEGWAQAVPTLLQDPQLLSSGGVELELRWRDGAWHIVPNERLLILLSGGLSLSGEEARP